MPHLLESQRQRREAGLIFAERGLAAFHRPMALVFTGLYAVFAILHLALPAHIALVMAPVASTSALLGLALTTYLARSNLLNAWVLPFMAVAISLNAVTHLLADPVPHMTTNLAITTFVAAFFFFRWHWFGAIVAMNSIGLAAAATINPAASEWFHYFIHFCESLILATIIFAVKRTIAMRLHDAIMGEFAARFAAEEAAKLAEVKAQEAEARARAATRAAAAKSDFLANMSHELRTPLNAILGFSDIMRQGAAKPQVIPEYAGYIHRSGSYLLSLINQILDLARAESGRLKLDEAWFALDALLDDIDLLSRPLAEQANLTLSLERAPGLMILGDTTRLQHALMHLVSNAAKFTPKGGQIRIGSSHDQSGLTLYVEDTGIGLAQDDVERVFEPFVQANGGYGKSHQGSGLGLTLARHIARLHAGDVTLQSQPGQGTEARLRIPPGRLRVSELDFEDQTDAANAA